MIDAGRRVTRASWGPRRRLQLFSIEALCSTFFVCKVLETKLTAGNKGLFGWPRRANAPRNAVAQLQGLPPHPPTSLQTTDGMVTFSAKDMPQDAATWARIQTVPLCWATIYLRAAHSCRQAGAAGARALAAECLCCALQLMRCRRSLLAPLQLPPPSPSPSAATCAS